MSTAGNGDEPDWFAVHGNDLIPVRLVDLACLVARMRQVAGEEDFETLSIVHERLFTCDLPRLEAYLPQEALDDL